MKRALLAAAAATLLGSSFAMAAGNPYITLTKHNFNQDGYAWADGQICKPCHTPHHADTSGVSDRLWNHRLSSATYTLYDGSSAAPTDAIPQGMDRISRLCLGCHDGTVALDAYGIDPATGNPFMGNAANLGTNASAWSATGGGLRNNLGIDFTNDHPVGVKGAFGSPYLKPSTPSTDGSGNAYLTSASGNKLTIYAVSGVTNQVVSCYTCHNPHGSGQVAGTPYNYLLRTDPADLCLTCHTK